MKLNRIYSIENKNGLVVYVGKTNQELSERLYQHKNDTNHPDKMEYLNNPINEVRIVELYVSEFQYDIPTEEQYYIDLYKPDEDLPNSPWFNRIRAKKLSRIDKQSLTKVLLKKDNTNKGEFITDEDFDDWLDS